MRHPAVADQFYPGSPKTLARTVTELFPAFGATKKEQASAVVSPHAGYIYSGALAAETFSGVVIPESVIILGPSHRGQEGPVALSSETWSMPLGDVPVDMELGSLLLGHSQHVSIDDLAHRSEHSLEVQIPFLQLLQKELRIVPLVVSHMAFPVCEEVAQSLAYAIRQSPKDVLIVASSDMSHYESRQNSTEKDGLALKAIEEFDPYGLYHTVLNNRISMCGFIPVVIALLAAKALGAKASKLVGYTDSGYVSGDTSQVVGYAGFVIS